MMRLRDVRGLNSETASARFSREWPATAARLSCAKRILASMPQRPAPRDLRASDSDRERVVAMLGEALADGRLSHEEYSERMPLALTARPLGSLAVLTTDL